LPSMVLQLYGLLLSLTDISTNNYIVLSLSICISISGWSTTMATLAPKSGSSMFSSRLVVHFLYYVSEVIVRITIFVMFFVSLNALGFVPLVIELLTRAFLINFRHQGNATSTNYIVEMSLWFGSDAFEGPAIVLSPESAYAVGGFALTTLYQLAALVIFSTLETPNLNTLRLLYATRNVTIISCLFVLPKVLLAFVISSWQVEGDAPKLVTTTNIRGKDRALWSNIPAEENARDVQIFTPKGELSSTQVSINIA